MAELLGALEADEIRLSHQPLVDLASGRVVGAESLLRWTRPNGEEVAPAVIAHLAGRAGLGEELTLWVLSRSVDHVTGWGLGPEFGLSLNASPRVVANQDFAGSVRRMLERTGFDPARVTIEITEPGPASEGGVTRAGMLALKEFGVTTSVDDFGVGWAGMALLDELPFGELKINRTLLLRSEEGGGRDKLIGAISQLGHAFGLTVVIEGVETRADLRMAWTMAADRAQGFYFSKAVPADQFVSAVAALEKRVQGTGFFRPSHHHSAAHVHQGVVA